MDKLKASNATFAKLETVRVSHSQFRFFKVHPRNSAPPGAPILKELGRILTQFRHLVPKTPSVESPAPPRPWPDAPH